MANCNQYEIGQDLLSPNRNFAPITSEVNEQGLLQVGGCGLSSLAERYGTPLYILDELSFSIARKTLQ